MKIHALPQGHAPSLMSENQHLHLSGMHKSHISPHFKLKPKSGFTPLSEHVCSEVFLTSSFFVLTVTQRESFSHSASALTETQRYGLTPGNTAAK